jgi:predicted ABC-type ATPase
VIRPELLGVYINPDDIEDEFRLLADAVRHTNRTYIFDNSRRQHIWPAEVTDGKVLEMKSDSMPVWFKRAVWEN